jgi:polysaccharide biosynthesis transport protein
MPHKPMSFGRASLHWPEFRSPAELLESFVHFLRQQYGVILSVSLLSIALGVTNLMIARPSYTAVATMLIDWRIIPLTAEVALIDSVVESQVIVLKSDELALSVIKKLRLNEDPEFIESDSLLELGSKSSPAPKVLLMRALDIFKSRLAVKRGTLYYAIEISFTSYDAEKAARIANAIFDAYIDAGYQATVRDRIWLQDRIRDLREQVSAVEQAVVDHRRDHNISNLSELESVSKSYRAIYEDFLQRYQQLSVTEARLISPGTRPSRQSNPKAVLTLVFSACAGIIFGFGIGVWRSMDAHSDARPPIGY